MLLLRMTLLVMMMVEVVPVCVRRVTRDVILIAAAATATATAGIVANLR